ncbi:MAG: hypothetical protein EAZ13_10090 [Sphingobacteriia bacterium]|nr:MAG: hypothetical protein EAZ13_10090 [Sphingobacteriia bacterium]
MGKFCAAQNDYKNTIDESMSRLVVSFPNPLINFQYERKINEQVSALAKTGLAFSISSGGFGSSGEIGSQASSFSSLEYRYYYNIKRRQRLGKSIRNFSAWYIGIEPYLASSSIASINQEKRIKNGSAGVYLNLGVQKQSSKNLYGAFYIGIAPFTTTLSAYNKTTSSFKRVWLNFSLGIVL